MNILKQKLHVFRLNYGAHTCLGLSETVLFNKCLDIIFHITKE